MAKISDYAKTTSLNDTDLFIVEKSDVGTRTVSRGDLAYQVFNSVPEMHGNIYRGKHLGTTFTAAQKSTITNGKFDDLFLGDYWTNNGITWRIVDFDYFFGYMNDFRHHVVIMPDKSLYTRRMHSENNTTGGIVSAELFVSGMSSAYDTAELFFGDSVDTHKELVSSAAIAGCISGDTQKDIGMGIPSSSMITGVESERFADGTGQANNRDGTLLLIRRGSRQFRALGYNPGLIRDFGGNSYWLSTILSSFGGGIISNERNLDFSDWAQVHGVRPYFRLY